MSVSRMFNKVFRQKKLDEGLIDLFHTNWLEPRCEKIRELLDEGANPDAKAQPHSNTALMATIQEADYPIYEELLYDYCDVVTLLIERGADIHLNESLLFTPIIQAAKHQDESRMMVELLKAGANPIPNTNKHLSPLVAVETAHENNSPNAYILEEYISARTSYSNSKTREIGLHQMVWKGDIDELKAILTQANINAVDHEQRTPLHLAALAGHTEICKILIAKGANVHAVNANKRTPLHFATMMAQEDAALLLYKNGADATALDQNHITSLDYTARFPGSTLGKKIARETILQIKSETHSESCSKCAAQQPPKRFLKRYISKR